MAGTTNPRMALNTRRWPNPSPKHEFSKPQALRNRMEAEISGMRVNTLSGRQQRRQRRLLLTMSETSISAMGRRRRGFRAARTAMVGDHRSRLTRSRQWSIVGQAGSPRSRLRYASGKVETFGLSTDG
jgi:hypothetical protein